MQYLGGKARIAKPLAEYINSRLKPNQPYWEPFVGSGWVISKIDKNRKRYGSDIHEELIAMWKALQMGWLPPEHITEEEYYNIKNNINNLPLRAFAGFGCSYGGKYWGGYARDPKSDRSYAKNSYNSLLKRLPDVLDVHFFCNHYKKSNPKIKTFIYCDPPYEGTTGFRNKFDNEEFWDWVRSKTVYGHTVLVSEYKAPSDFTCVWKIQTRTDMSDKNNQKIERIERLFEYIKGEN